MINGLTVRQLRPTFRLSPSQQKTQIVGESVTHCGWKSSAEPQGRSSFSCAHDRLFESEWCGSAMGGFFHDVSNGLETKVTAIEPFLYKY